MKSQPLDAVLTNLAQTSNDPMVQSLIQALGQMLGDDDDTEDDTAREQRRARARAQLLRMRRTIAALRKRNALVASALGACACWGSDDICRDCNGRGRPGCFQPDNAAFHALVTPLFRARPELLQTFANVGRSSD